MLTEIYIEALLVDEEIADKIWEAWDSGEINDFVAARGWWAIVTLNAMNLNSDNGTSGT